MSNGPFPSPARDEGESSFAPERFRDDWSLTRGIGRPRPSRGTSSPPNVYSLSETLAIVRAAVDRLPANQRTVICLRDIDGWTSVDVCALLGVSEANQRVLLHRARARVRQTLEDYFGGAVS